MIATNTIAQGDTRKSSLRWICQNSGTIFEARRRFRWPGEASVVVSIIHIYQGKLLTYFLLDGKRVDKISAYLFHAGSDDDPKSLLEQTEKKATKGVEPYGEGFLFEDSNTKATPIMEMEKLIANDPKNQEVIFPFLGGKQLNTEPQHRANRYIINFGERTEDEARQWEDLMKIVETKVRPERRSKAKEVAEWPWWQFWRGRRELYEVISKLERVLVIARVSETAAFTFVPTNQVINEKIVVFPFDSYQSLAIMQSRIHEIWARFFSSTLKDDLQYTASDCFDTFPFPENWEANPTLEAVGTDDSEKNLGATVGQKKCMMKF